MSCFPEWTYAVYVDGELAPDQLRPIEAHLIGCERCRRTVLALREEGRLLADTLRGSHRAEERALPLEAPARGLLSGAPLALALSGAVATALGLLLETRLPSGADWLSPSRLFGVNEMVFDLVFAARDRVPGLLEFGVAIAATASVAALVTFLASALLRRVSGPMGLGLLALVLLGVPSAARAHLDLRLGQSVRVQEGETVEGTLVVTGDSADIDGVVSGNLLVFVEMLAIRGRVEGNVFGAAREMELDGVVTGSLHVLSEDARVEGEVEGQAVAGCDRFTLASGGHVEKDLVVFGDKSVLDGTVGRDVIGLLKRIELRGAVARDVEVYSDRVVLLGGSSIGGDLRAHVRDADRVEIAPAAVVSGETATLIETHPRPSHLDRYRHAHFYLWVLVRLVGAFGVGMILYALFPRIFSASLPSGRDFFVSLGMGFALLVLAPLALILTALTIVGIPAAVIGAAVYLVALYVAGICVAALIGISLTKPASAGLRDFGMALLVGLAVVAVATHLPFVGVLARIVVVLVGLGLLLRLAIATWGSARVGAP